MKKLLVSLLAVIATVMVANAQTELAFSYGGYTQMDATDMHDGGKINTAWGAVTGALNFKINSKMWVGPSYTFSSADYKHSDANAYYHVIMLNARYQYYRNSIVNLYAKLGLGADITHISWDGDSKNKGYFAFQIVPVGASVDINRNVAMFGELGFGAQGLLQVGFKFKL